MNELAQLEALLAAITGSTGTSELTGGQVDTLLFTCHRLASEAIT